MFWPGGVFFLYLGVGVVSPAKWAVINLATVAVILYDAALEIIFHLVDLQIEGGFSVVSSIPNFDLCWVQDVP